MFRRRRQATRLGTRVARSALRTAKSVVRQARGAFTAAAVGASAYKAGKKVKKYLSKKAGLSDSAPGNDWTVSKRRVGRKKKPTLSTLNRMMEVGMHKQIFRWQAITNFDTNVGYHKLWNAFESVNGFVSLPVHMYDLSSFNNIGSYAPARRFLWSSTASTADIASAPLSCQTSTGGTDTSGYWYIENGEGTLTNSRVMRHDWSDIRINFYGPRKRTTKFEVLFVRIKDDLANPLIAASANAAYKELMNYLERPCIYSNLQSYQSNVATKMKIVKKFTYWVSAGQTTDVDTTVGKIKEARIFMRHDRVYNLDWRHEGAADMAHGPTDGIDFVSDTLHHNGPWYGSRLIMFIRAFAPERRTVTNYDVVADANVDPTYDIIIRNGVSTPA